MLRLMFARMRRSFVRGRGHFFASLFLVVSSVWISKQAYNMGLGRLSSPGPGLAVFVASALLGLLAFHQLTKPIVVAEETSRSGPGKKHGSRNVLVFLTLAAYVAFLNAAGFVLITFLTLTLLFLLLQEGKKRWGSAIGMAAFISGLTYLVFSYGFRLPLPRGLIDCF